MRARKAVELLQKGGVWDETPTTVLVHLDEAIPTGVGPMNCADLLSTYITLRVGH